MRLGAWIGFLASGLVGSAAVGACGGSVVFVEDDGAGGSSSSSSTAKSTGSSSTKSTVSATQTSTSSVTTTTVTTGPIEPFCEFGEITTACDNCAIEASGNACQAQAEACNFGDECFEYANCVSQCFSDPNCCSNCINFFPKGAVVYTEFLFCVVCQSCPVECAEATPGFCN